MAITRHPSSCTTQHSLGRVLLDMSVVVSPTPKTATPAHLLFLLPCNWIGVCQFNKALGNSLMAAPAKEYCVNANPFMAYILIGKVVYVTLPISSMSPAVHTDEMVILPGAPCYILPMVTTKVYFVGVSLQARLYRHSPPL